MISRLFAYTRQLESERDFLRAQLSAHLGMLERSEMRTQELIDSMVFHRMPKRLVEPTESKLSDTVVVQSEEKNVEPPPLQPATWSDDEYSEWLYTLQGADPLTRADMLAEHQIQYGRND